MSEKHIEVLKGNEIIGEFIGMRRDEMEDRLFYLLPTFGWTQPKNMQYHASWEWQIPVWNKLYKEVTDKIGDEKKLKEFLVFYEQLLRCIKLYTAMESFESLCAAIKWYNSQK